MEMKMDVETCVQDNKSVHNFSDLPSELQLKIFSYLNPSELGIAAQTCKDWRDKAYDPMLWKHLHFEIQTADPIAVHGFVKALHRFTKVQSLTFENYIPTWPHLTPILLEMPLFQTVKCVTLLEKNFMEAGMNIDEVLKIIFIKCPFTETLNLGSCAFLTNRTAINISSLKCLKNLNLNFCLNLYPDTILYLVKQCPLLETLDLGGINVGDNILFEISSRLSRTLKSLSLECHTVYDKGLKFLQKCQELTRLSLCRSLTITDIGISFVRNLTNLKSLKLVELIRLTPKGLLCLFQESYRKDLEHLEMSKVQCNNEVMIEIARSCKNLKSLSLQNCNFVTDKGLKPVINSCTRLQTLEIALKNVTGECLQDIPSHLPDLTFLDLYDCKSVNIQLVEQLAQNMKSLKIHVYEASGMSKYYNVTGT